MEENGLSEMKINGKDEMNEKNQENEEDSETPKRLEYGVEDNPPWYLSIVLGFQVCCLIHGEPLKERHKIFAIVIDQNQSCFPEQLPLLLNLQLRFCKFINKCLVNENEIVKFVSKVAISNPMSNTGKNYLELYSWHNEGLVFLLFACRLV